MRYFLENESVCAEFESYGAEIRSLKEKGTGREYLWSGDATYWNKISPFLFPFIGKLVDGKYEYNGRVLPADKHGFGQRVEFEVAEQSGDRIVFRLVDSEETYAKYPFHFCLDIEYVLGEDCVEENWYVKNTGDNTMYFSIGAHTGFVCPFSGDGSRVGHKIMLHGAEHKNIIFSLRIDEEGLVTDELLTLDIGDGLITIEEDTFADDALIFDGEGVTAAGLCDEDGKEYVRVECDCPVWGVWTKPDNGASYVCLEPWYGICDYKGYEGDISTRPYTNVVEPGETWKGGNITKFGKALDK